MTPTPAPDRSDRSDTADPRTIAGELRKARTRARLIEAGVLVLAARGPEATVIDHVISQAGVARGTFYNYFPSMDDLLAAAKQELGKEMLCLVTAGADPSQDPARQVATQLRTFVDLAMRYPLFLEFHARLGMRGLGPGNLIYDSAPGAMEQAQALGRFCPMPPLMAVDILQASTFATLRRLQAGDEVDLTGFVAAMLRMLGVPAPEAQGLAAQPVARLRLGADSLIVRSEQARATRAAGVTG